MDKKQVIIKNGGFPPIKYCKDATINKTSKERFFSNAPRQNINIRQLLTDTTNKKPLIITDNATEDIIEEVSVL
jgi:hypothetical protein